MMPVPPRGGPGTICLKQPEQQVHPVGDKSSVWQGWQVTWLWCRADGQPRGLYLGHVGNYHLTSRWLSDPNLTTLYLYTSPTIA
jgi:hypothetical protein